jgi:hypothetical protein
LYLAEEKDYDKYLSTIQMMTNSFELLDSNISPIAANNPDVSSIFSSMDNKDVDKDEENGKDEENDGGEENGKDEENDGGEENGKDEENDGGEEKDGGDVDWTPIFGNTFPIILWILFSFITNIYHLLLFLFMLHLPFRNEFVWC